MKTALDPRPAKSFADGLPVGGERCAVLLDGEVTVTPRLRRQVDGCRTIAADGAIRHAAQLVLTPDLWVGDFDSTAAREITGYDAVPRQPFPRDKDKTDGEIAIEAAIEAGADTLVLVGALGGRTDHATAHLLRAIMLARRGVFVLLTSGAEEAVPLTRAPYSPGWPTGTVHSVLAFSDLEGLTLTAARWPLAARDVPLGATLTLSNETVGKMTASLNRGAAHLVGQVCEAPAK